MNGERRPADADWSAGTYDGLRRAQVWAIAGLTPQERREWLDAALGLAEGSGAPARVRAGRSWAASSQWGAP
ncbi:MAG TPA: hypothetical protein VNB94_01490 [Mycobacteriales bacterium]|nr:hypothetical protein [Mycobacteriales bacterium]